MTPLVARRLAVALDAAQARDVAFARFLARPRGYRPGWLLFDWLRTRGEARLWALATLGAAVRAEAWLQRRPREVRETAPVVTTLQDVGGRLEACARSRSHERQVFDSIRRSAPTGARDPFQAIEDELMPVLRDSAVAEHDWGTHDDNTLEEFVGDDLAVRLAIAEWQHVTTRPMAPRRRHDLERRLHPPTVDAGREVRHTVRRAIRPLRASRLWDGAPQVADVSRLGLDGPILTLGDVPWARLGGL